MAIKGFAVVIIIIDFDLMFFFTLMIFLKTATAVITCMLNIIMMIYDINDNAIVEYDRREFNNEMNVSKRMCLNGCVNDIYSFNCYKNVMILKEMKTNEELLPGAG